MPRFVHRCAPCDTCGSSGQVSGNASEGDDTDGYGLIECPTCEGQSTPCECQERWDDEGQLRYEIWRDRNL